MRYLITFSYDGSKFKGYQKQPRLKTVQGEIEKALKEFSLDIKDKIMVDIGSSTGGFTDCALQNGAKLVYAVDVGTNQLVWKLRNDPRVIVKEQTNYKNLRQIISRVL